MNDVGYYKNKEKYLPCYVTCDKQGTYHLNCNKNHKEISDLDNNNFYTFLKNSIVFLENNNFNPVYIDYLKDYLKKFNFYDISLVDYKDNITLCLNTGSCNNKCFYCFNDVEKIPIMNFHVAKYLIDKNIDYITAISLTGGEPLLNPQLSKIINYVKKFEKKIKIDTSLSGEINESILKKIDLINISIKNEKYLLNIFDKIKQLYELNYKIIELNLVYHPQYLSLSDLKSINSILASYKKIPLTIVEMDIIKTSYKNSVTRQELINAATIFKEHRDVFINTKSNGLEKI